MSHHAASPPSRPPSSASSTASSSLSLASGASSQHHLPRVHDHSRPLPPPRLPSTLGSSPITTQPQLVLATSSTSSSSTSSTSTSSTSSRPAATTTQTQSSQGQAEVTLQVPRPDGERVANEYVETPFRPSAAANNRQVEHAAEDRLKANNHQRACKQQHQPKSEAQVHRPSHRPLRHREPPRPQSRSSSVITKQPVSFTKEPAGALAPASQSRLGGLSIMCDYCGRCRCESCREPAPLPSRWLCDNACFCSAETALDYASCLCCVKGLFYHCTDGGTTVSSSSSSGADPELTGNCADEPCSCTGSRKAARWTCLGALALVLPCLLCYWPLRGCVALCEMCYAKHANQGCRCDPRGPPHSTELLGPGAGLQEVPSPGSRDPEKRLLEPTVPEL